MILTALELVDMKLSDFIGAEIIMGASDPSAQIDIMFDHK